MIVAVAIALSVHLSSVSQAGTFTFPVQSEQAITGTTTGLGGAQSDDGVLETLRETDAAPDPVTAPATQTLTTGTMVGGTFPGDVSSQDGVFVQYRETTDAVEAAIGYRSNTGTNTVSSPKTRTWSGSAWSAETEQSTAASPIRAIRMAWSPIASNTRIFVTQSDDGWLDAYVCGPSCTVTTNIGQVWLSGSPPGTPEKRFDITYEQASGDALLVYGVYTTVTTRDLAYRTYIGGSWSAEQYLDDTGHATDLQYRSVRLASRAGSDQIGLIAGENNNTHVNVWIWSGISFGLNTEFTTVDAVTREQVAIGWESNSGNLVAVTVDAMNPERVAFREYTTGWSGISTVQCAGNPRAARWIALSANPVSTAADMVLAVGDDGSGLSTCYWNGSTFTNFQTQDTAIDSTAARAFDFAWESSGSKGLLVYGTTAGQITYRTFTAPNTWGAATNAAMGANTHPWVRLAANPFPRTGAVKIIGAVMETTANDLGAITWDGFTFTVVGAGTFTADTGTTTYDSFDLAYHDPNDDQLLVRYDWTGVPAGVSYTLQIKGYREDEDINVQVLTPASTWNTRLTISATTNTLYTYTLTPVEYNAGVPSIRFVDANGPGGTQSDLWIDWAAITTVELRYALEVRQNVTGITTGSSPILTVKGNITSGGENFHIHVWNFTSASWDLLLAMPFTPTIAYHNASLTADHLSGGTVRVRFVDAASQDATRWALSLDFVAVVITNDQPVLTNAGVSPASGNIATSFTFFVRYSDAENDAPAFVNLTLGGISYGMVENNSADTNYVDGKDYFLGRVIGTRGTFNYSFSARASSGDLTLATTAVQQVSVLNRAPSISNAIGSDSVHTGQSYAHDLNGTDPDNDTLAWSLSTNASWLSVGPANGTVWGLAPSAPSTFFVDVMANDGFGGSATDNYTLSVANVGPTITNPIPSDAVHTSRPYVRDFNGSDPEGDSLLWSISTNASWLSLGPANGTVWGVAPPAVALYYVNLGLSDGFGGSATDNYTLSVGNVGPMITNPIPSDAVHSARSYLRDFDGTDPEGDTLLWSMSTNASWLSFGSANGTVWGLAPSTVGVFYVDMGLSDGFGGSASDNYTLSVGNVAPAILNPIGTSTSIRRASVSIDFNASDPESDTLSWSLRTNAAFLSVGAANGTVSGLTVNVPATYWVEVTVSDGFGGSDVVNFTLSVVNRPPQASVTAPGTAIENDAYQGTFSGTDPDGDALSWTLATNATWLAIDPISGTLSGTALAGVYFVNVTARDPYGGIAYQNLTVTVARTSAQPPPQEPPVIEGGLLTITLGVVALAILAFPAAALRRRRDLEQAFLLDSSGAVRMRYDAPGAPFDEVQLMALLGPQDRSGMDTIAAKPHTLHVVRRDEGEWILVSRSKDAARVVKAAESVFATAGKDWPVPASRGAGSEPKT